MGVAIVSKIDKLCYMSPEFLLAQCLYVSNGGYVPGVLVFVPVQPLTAVPLPRLAVCWSVTLLPLSALRPSTPAHTVT